MRVKGYRALPGYHHPYSTWRRFSFTRKVGGGHREVLRIATYDYAYNPACDQAATE